MPFDAPFNLGPFEVNALGHIAPRPGDVAPGFVFHWRARAVHARLELGEGDGGRLFLRTSLGRIPSTALARDSDLRQRSFATLRALPRNLPGDWRMRLMPDHRLRLETEALVDLPIAAADLVTTLSRFLLELAPYLDLLDEIGVTPTPAWLE